jgi:transposase InsO family protein
MVPPTFSSTLHDYATPRALEAGLASFFLFYNDERLHAALDYLPPTIVYAAA